MGDTLNPSKDSGFENKLAKAIRHTDLLETQSTNRALLRGQVPSREEEARLLAVVPARLLRARRAALRRGGGGPLPGVDGRVQAGAAHVALPGELRRGRVRRLRNRCQLGRA